MTENAAPILIVDDDRDVRRSIGELLREEGYAVADAPDGLVALDLMRNKGLHPAVILLDLMMPGMDGWDFRHEQLRDPVLAQVPVVVVTASGFSRESIRTQFGGTEFLAKPFQPESLLAIIRRLTASRPS